MQLLLEKFYYLLLYLLAKPFFAFVPHAPAQRVWANLLSRSMVSPWGQSVKEVQIAGVPCQRRQPSAVGGNDLRILYVHGGWYCIGGAVTHRPLAAYLALEAEATVYLPEYRLAPEHPAPAALDDLLAVYRQLAAEPGPPLVLAGDSAGGGLCLALALAIREAGLPTAQALYLISPLTDITHSGDSIRTHRWRDCLLSERLFRYAGKCYLPDQDPRDPRYSPLFGNLSGLPPMLVQVGSEEVLYSDSTRLAERVRAQGGVIELEEFPGLWHDFQVQAGVLRRGRVALANAASFLRHHALEQAPH